MAASMEKIQVKRALRLAVLLTLTISVTLSAAAQVAFAQVDTQPPGAPSIQSEHITAEHGLSNNAVWGIAQDDQGFMWFATFDGLNRHDGHEFKAYRHDLEDPGSLSNNLVREVCKDRRVVSRENGNWKGGVSYA